MAGKRYLFKYYYIGSKKFHGSQRQDDFLTIEGCIISALKEKDYIEDEKSSGCEFASRTDRLVAARGAAFSFVTEKKPILMAINSALPREIGLWAFAEVPVDFLSRYNAILRHYKYIVLKKNASFNLDLMKKACKELEGRHDFKNFSKREKEEKKTVRDMNSVELDVKNDRFIFDFKSRAFLRQQIRRMVRKIMELGLEKITFEEFLKIFDISEEISFQPADPEGLILWDVKYDNKIKFKVDLRSLERMQKYFRAKEHQLALKHGLFEALQHDDFSQ